MPGCLAKIYFMNLEMRLISKGGYYSKNILEFIASLTWKTLCKWDHFESRLNALKIIQNLSALVSKQIWNRAFKWGTKHWFWSWGCKDIRGQSWSLKKISADQPSSDKCARGWPSWQIFFSKSNFDLQYLWNPLTKIDV